MNDDRLKKLFALARTETPPSAPEGFDARVLAAVRRERRAAPVSVWEQIGALFPRLAVGAALVIALCLAAEFCWSAMQPSSLAAEVSELSDQWLFAANGDAHE
jgi:hypothetical protein